MPKVQEGTMNLSKNNIKWITSLQIKKFRQKFHKFPVEGDKIVLELLRDTRWTVNALYALPEWLTRNASLLQRQGLSVQEVGPEDLSRISAMQSPQQALAIADIQVLPLREEVLRTDLSLYLDGIQDPGNLGAILRIADWFGVRHVFVSPDTVEVFNPKVIQASMGAFLRICTEVTTLESLKTRFPYLQIYGADLSGENVFQAPGLQRGALVVIGNEGSGISPDCAALLDGKITIPRHPAGAAESLNAAVATGIIVAALRNFS